MGLRDYVDPMLIYGEPDEDEADETLPADLPNVVRCLRCGQNFIAEVWYDACTCEGPAADNDESIRSLEIM